MNLKDMVVSVYLGIAVKFTKNMKPKESQKMTEKDSLESTILVMTDPIIDCGNPHCLEPIIKIDDPTKEFVAYDKSTGKFFHIDRMHGAPKEMTIINGRGERQIIHLLEHKESCEAYASGNMCSSQNAPFGVIMFIGTEYITLAEAHEIYKKQKKKNQ